MTYKCWISQNCNHSDAIKFKGEDFRLLAANEVINKYYKYRHGAGISRISFVSEYDCMSVPVVAAIRPSVGDKQISSCQGKGSTNEQAFASALMESFERHALNVVRVDFVSKIEGLSDNFHFPISTQELKSGMAIDWIAAKEVMSNTLAFVPKFMVEFPTQLPLSIDGKFFPNTTGVASGCSILDASCQAIYEVIERNATSLFRERFPAVNVHLESIEDECCTKLIHTLIKNKVDIKIFDLSSLAVVSTFMVVTKDFDSYLVPNVLICGQASHLDSTIALKRALLEALQSRSVAIQGSREDLTRHSTEWTDKASAQLSWDSLIGQCLKGNITNTKMLATNKVEEFMEVVDHLKNEQVTEMYIVDLTKKENNIPVVKVIIPKLVDLYVQKKRPF